MNVVVLMGRLVADPELRTTQAGVSVVSFRIAVDRRFKDQDGNRQADFINIVAWRQSAEFVQRFFHKGDPIVVNGSLQVREYTDKEGNKRTSFEVQADNCSFVLSRPNRDGQGGGYQQGGGSYQGGYQEHQAPAAPPAPTYANAGQSDFQEIAVDDDDLEGLPF